MDAPLSSSSIAGLEEEIDLHQVLLENLPPSEFVERQRTMDHIQNLRAEIDARRDDRRSSVSRLSPSSYSSNDLDPYSSMQQTGCSNVNQNQNQSQSRELKPSRWGPSTMFPPSRPEPQSAPRQTSPSRKRRPADAGFLGAPQPASKRAASMGSPIASSPGPDEMSEMPDDLLQVLGFDSKDSFREFQQSQKKAEQWLEERKAEERRDAEYARRLQNNPLASPRPSSAQSSSSTNYSGANIFNAPSPPDRPLDRPLPSNAPHARDMPMGDSMRPFTNDFSQPRCASQSRVPHIMGPSQPMGYSRPPSAPFRDSDDSDLAEISPADFNSHARKPAYRSPYMTSAMPSRAPNAGNPDDPRRPGYQSPYINGMPNRALHISDSRHPAQIGTMPNKPNYSGPLSRPDGPPGIPNRPYPPLGSTLGSSMGPAGPSGMPNDIYGPNVLQNTMARLGATSRDWNFSDSFMDEMDDLISGGPLGGGPLSLPPLPGALDTMDLPYSRARNYLT